MEEKGRAKSVSFTPERVAKPREDGRTMQTLQLHLQLAPKPPLDQRTDISARVHLNVGFTAAVLQGKLNANKKAAISCMGAESINVGMKIILVAQTFMRCRILVTPAFRTTVQASSRDTLIRVVLHCSCLDPNYEDFHAQGDKKD